MRIQAANEVWLISPSFPAAFSIVISSYLL